MQHLPNRGIVDLQIELPFQFRTDLSNRNVSALFNLSPYPVLMRGKLSMACIAGVGARFERAAFAFQNHHVIYEFNRNTKVRRRLTMRMTGFNMSDNALA